MADHSETLDRGHGDDAPEENGCDRRPVGDARPGRKLVGRALSLRVLDAIVAYGDNALPKLNDFLQKAHPYQATEMAWRAVAVIGGPKAVQILQQERTKNPPGSQGRPALDILAERATKGDARKTTRQEQSIRMKGDASFQCSVVPSPAPEPGPRPLKLQLEIERVRHQPPEPRRPRAASRRGSSPGRADPAA